MKFVMQFLAKRGLSPLQSTQTSSEAAWMPEVKLVYAFNPHTVCLNFVH
jgi:hypothetical protein